MTRVRALNDVMEFDRVIRVHADGSVTDEPNMWAPDLLDGRLSARPGDEWELMTGYTGQQGGGDILHDSEYIGGGLERAILASPGLYVAIVAYWLDDDEGTADEGWAVARILDGES